MELEVERVLHMNGGAGENSYANNSLLQRKVIEQVHSMLENSAKDVYRKLQPECLKVADLGCSSGPNTLIVISQIMRAIVADCRCLARKPPSFQIFLNDLPGNDFNTIFRSLHKYSSLRHKQENKEDDDDDDDDLTTFENCFISGTPGSFYTKLFPANSLHFVHSSYSLHFLSQVPKGLVKEGDAIILNKGNIYISKSSGPKVHAAYRQQFEKDFSSFLGLRAQEIVPGGSMLITTMGSIEPSNPQSIYELFSLALQEMALEGVIEEKKLDLFNIPYYAATGAEVKKVVEAEGSFVLRKLESFVMPWDANLGQGHVDVSTRAEFITNYMRAVVEPMFSVHFGDQLVMDDLFARFKAKIIDSIETDQKCEFINLIIYLTKKHS